jgi:hypothetical protein
MPCETVAYALFAFGTFLAAGLALGGHASPLWILAAVAIVGGVLLRRAIRRPPRPK